MEKYIKKKLVDDNVFKKNFFIFEKDSLLIYQNEETKNPTENISYQKMSCIHMLSSSSFYFKGIDKGFALFFKDFSKNDAKLWYGYLKFLKSTFDKEKIKIQEFDVGEYFDCGMLDTEVKYCFKFDYYVDGK